MSHPSPMVPATHRAVDQTRRVTLAARQSVRPRGGVPGTMDFLTIAAHEGGPDDVLCEVARIIRGLGQELERQDAERQLLDRRVARRSDEIDLLVRVVNRRLDRRDASTPRAPRRSAGAA
jgi:hypothetical protein